MSRYCFVRWGMKGLCWLTSDEITCSIVEFNEKNQMCIYIHARFRLVINRLHLVISIVNHYLNQWQKILMIAIFATLVEAVNYISWTYLCVVLHHIRIKGLYLFICCGVCVCVYIHIYCFSSIYLDRGDQQNTFIFDVYWFWHSFENL